jgi:GTP-binding protein
LFRIALSDAVVDFVDLPGYGYAKRSKRERRAWGPLIEGFLRSRTNLRAAVVIVDVRRGIQEDDRQLLDFLAGLRIPPVVVATKLDKLALNRRKIALEELREGIGCPVVGFSAETGEGRQELLDTLIRKTVGAADESGERTGQR